MFDSEGVLKIVDYGFHRIKTDTQAMTQAGTVCWVAPEVFQGCGYSVGEKESERRERGCKITKKTRKYNNK
jgi:hypothetical protein